MERGKLEPIFVPLSHEQSFQLTNLSCNDHDLIVNCTICLLNILSFVFSLAQIYILNHVLHSTFFLLSLYFLTLYFSLPFCTLVLLDSPSLFPFPLSSSYYIPLSTFSLNFLVYFLTMVGIFGRKRNDTLKQLSQFLVKTNICSKSI